MKIRQYRMAKRLKQYELAEMLGVNANTVCQWETGCRTPRASTLVKLSKILGCTIIELLEEAK